MSANHQSLDTVQPRNQPVHLGLRDTRGTDDGGGVCHGSRERLRRAGLDLQIEAPATDLPNSLPRGDVCGHAVVLDGQTGWGGRGALARRLRGRLEAQPTWGRKGRRWRRLRLLAATPTCSCEGYRGGGQGKQRHAMGWTSQPGQPYDSVTEWRAR